MNTQHRVLYEQFELPVLQNRVFPTPEAARDCTTGDIRLVQDARTGLVRNSSFDPSLLAYDSSYHNEQEYSSAFRRHLDNVADIVMSRVGRSNLAEVGCGKGFFLELLLSRGCDIVGFDPVYDGINPRVQKSFVDSRQRLALNGIILRHVLEHISDPITFLTQMREITAGRGLIYIEVPCFEWICETKAWFDIFYEHVNYFRLEDFFRIFGTVVEAGRLFGGQYLYCIAELRSLRPTPSVGWTRVDLPIDFPPTAYLDSVAARRSPGAHHREAVWGCASKGVIFSLLRERAGHPIDVAIDINPKKQGMYLPGTGLKVRDPQTALADLPGGSTIYVMNPMYAAEVAQCAGDGYRYVFLSCS